MLCAPIFDRKGRVMGAITLINRRDGKPFTQTDENRLKAINSHIASAVEEAVATSTSEQGEYGKVDLAKTVKQIQLYFPDDQNAAEARWRELIESERRAALTPASTTARTRE